MTRDQALQKAERQLDEIVESHLERYEDCSTEIQLAMVDHLTAWKLETLATFARELDGFLLADGVTTLH